MTEDADGFATVRQTVRIAAPPETVWSFWTEPARLAEWWGTAADLELEAGGRFRVVMASGPIMRGAFVEIEPPRRLVFTFGWEQRTPDEPMAPGSTRVEVTITADGGESVLELRHLDVPVGQADEHERGWQLFVGERLVAVRAPVSVEALEIGPPTGRSSRRFEPV